MLSTEWKSQPSVTSAFTITTMCGESECRLQIWPIVSISITPLTVSLKLRARKIPDYTAADLLLFNFAFKDRPAPVLNMTHTHKTFSNTHKKHSPPLHLYPSSGKLGCREKKRAGLCLPIEAHPTENTVYFLMRCTLMMFA